MPLGTQSGFRTPCSEARPENARWLGISPADPPSWEGKNKPPTKCSKHLVENNINTFCKLDMPPSYPNLCYPLPARTSVLDALPTTSITCCLDVSILRLRTFLSFSDTDHAFCAKLAKTMLLHGSSLGCSLLFFASGDKNCYGAKMAHGIQWVTMIYHGLHIVIVIPHSKLFPLAGGIHFEYVRMDFCSSDKKTTKQNANTFDQRTTNSLRVRICHPSISGFTQQPWKNIVTPKTWPELLRTAPF